MLYFLCEYLHIYYSRYVCLSKFKTFSGCAFIHSHMSTQANAIRHCSRISPVILKHLIYLYLRTITIVLPERGPTYFLI